MIEKSGISGWRTLRLASFSRVLPRRGCSSTSKTTLEPSLVVTLMGTISLAKRPSSMAAMAFSCERSAQASISSRLMPAIWAVFQPTVIDMSRDGASGESGCEGDIQSTQSCVPTVRFFVIGVFDIDCTPPAMIASSMPAMIDAAAVSTAARPAAQ